MLREGEMSHHRSLLLRGINYDTGTAYFADEITRKEWDLAEVSRDLRVIRDDLHCNSVALYGTDLDRLAQAAQAALGLDLHVVLQLRSIDQSRGSALAAIGQAAELAQALAPSGAIALNVGCEMTLFSRGFLPGRNFMQRMMALTFLWPLLPLVNWRLNRFLTEAAAAARQHFSGPLLYSAGTWEDVDWAPFDFVGVNLYRDNENERSYIHDLRRLVGGGKPVIITEFGCCAFEGADRQGGGGWLAVDYRSSPPKVKPGYSRSERTQAEYLDELLSLFEAEDVHGAYVFEYSSPANPYSPAPADDLDLASYGVVRTDRQGRGTVPKEAFATIAEHYQDRREARAV